MKKIYTFFIPFLTILLFATQLHADMISDCMQAVSNNPNFQTVMTSEIFKTKSDFTQEFVTQNKAKIFGTIGATMLIEPKCSDNFSTMARRANGKVWLKQPDHTYAFQFKMADLFSYIQIPAGIMLYNKTTLRSGDVIKLSDIKELYWSDECSDHTIWDNLDDDAAVNIAGQKVFSQYGGSKNEFFLDFEEGNDRRAFPGLVLMDKTNSSSEAIVSFNNLHTAITATESFAGALNGTICARDGLAAYTVALNVQPLSTGDKNAYGYTAGIVGGAATLVGTSAALNALGIATAATTKVLSLAGLTAAAGASVSWVPVVGWIAAGVLATGAAVIALFPYEIADIQQVIVLDGPHLLR